MNLNLLINQFTNLFNKFNNRQDSCFILSVSDLKQQAITVHKYIKDESIDIKQLIEELYFKLSELNIYPIIFKIDQVIDKQELTYLELKNELSKYKPGYFRRGIIFDNSNTFVLLESELNSNKIIKDNEIDFNNEYFKIKFNSKPNITDNNLIYTFDTKSYILYDDSIFEIDNITKYRKINNKLNINLLKRILRLLGNYLLLNIQNNGQFNYLYFPISNKYKPKYNILRHLGTIWSLLKLYQYFNWVDYKVAIYQTVKFIIVNFIETKTVSGINLSFVKSEGLINLGGTALASIVLIDFYNFFKDNKYSNILNQLILGLAYLQENDGSFKHTLNVNDLSVNTKFKTIYYHDEALLALIKYYKSINQNENILNVIKNGLKYCIKNGTNSYMDHWLSYSVNEFINIDDSLKYIKLGIDNFNPFLSTMDNADTIYNIMLELLCQSKIMLGKVSDLDLEYNKDLFEKVLIKRAEIQLDGFGWPEIAMYFKRPDLILNSIFIRHKGFRIRIDDLQHTILGLLYYIQILEGKVL